MLALRDPFRIFNDPFFAEHPDDYTRSKASVKKTSFAERVTDEGYELSLDLPGVDPDKVEAHANNGYIVVAAKREDTGADLSMTRYVGDLYDLENAHASMKHGVLTIRLKLLGPTNRGKISSIKINR